MRTNLSIRRRHSLGTSARLLIDYNELKFQIINKVSEASSGNVRREIGENFCFLSRNIIDSVEKVSVIFRTPVSIGIWDSSGLHAVYACDDGSNESKRSVWGIRVRIDIGWWTNEENFLIVWRLVWSEKGKIACTGVKNENWRYWVCYLVSETGLKFSSRRPSVFGFIYATMVTEI